MKAGILSLLEDAPDASLSEINQNTRVLEIDHEQSYLDGSTYLEGQAAERTTEDEKRAQIGGGSIAVEKIREEKVLDTDFLADLENRFLLIGSSDGEFLYNMIWAQTGAQVNRAEIDIVDFVRTIRKREQSNLEYWMAAKGGDLGTKIGYHMDAEDALARSANIGIGFEYRWQNSMLKGVVYESGYVALFEPKHWDSGAFLKWVNEELLQFADYPEDEEETEQTRLDHAAADPYKVDGETYTQVDEDDIDSGEDQRSLEDLVEAIVDEYDPDGPTSLTVIEDHMADKHDLNAQELEDRVRHELGMEVDHDG